MSIIEVESRLTQIWNVLDGFTEVQDTIDNLQETEEPDEDALGSFEIVQQQYRPQNYWKMMQLRLPTVLSASLTLLVTT